MTTTNSKLGQAFSTWLDTIANFYDADIMATIKAAAAASPSPATVEIAVQLLNTWSGTGLTLPTANPTFSFPADHGEHWDMPIEWRYLTLSLNLTGGGRVSAICNIFRKAIATAATAPGLTPLERQIYSTSIAVTLELPGQSPVHYNLPVQTFSSLEDAIEVANDPFKMVMGQQVSLTGTSDVFPIAFTITDAGDPRGRPSRSTSPPRPPTRSSCKATRAISVRPTAGCSGTITAGPNRRRPARSQSPARPTRWSRA